MQLTTDAKLVTNNRPAQWIIDRFVSSPRKITVVGSLVPPFDRYARILHPAGSSDGELAWGDIAKVTGVTLHAGSQWETLKLRSNNQYYDPPAGFLSASLLAELCDVLGHFTASSDLIWMLYWVGYGAFDSSFRAAASVKLPGRDYVLVSSTLETLRNGGVFEPDEGYQQSPNLWWPNDQSWCVATEVDLRSTLVGGSSECIEAVLTDGRIEAFPINQEDRVDLGSDSSTD